MKQIVNPDGSLYASEWIHNGKTYKFTLKTERKGYKAIETLDEILYVDDNIKGMFPRHKINRRFSGAEIIKTYMINVMFLK